MIRSAGIVIGLVVVGLLVLVGGRARLLNRSHSVSPPLTAAESHAVLLHVPLGQTMPSNKQMVDSHAFQHKLEAAIDKAGVGELDGDEWGGGECVIYCYGPDADRLFAVMLPVISQQNFPKGSFALKRYGGPDCTKVERVDISKLAGK